MYRLLPIFTNNGILVGNIEAYCLLCRVTLTDVLEHIKNRLHITKLKNSLYLKKYRNDFIKMMYGVYFCEVCHTTVPTASKVAMHVTDKTHINRKKAQLTRVGTSIFFQGDKLIAERAWNGFIDGTCVVCNTDIHDYLCHVSEQRHARNVVRSTVTTDNDDNIYRKIDGGYQCLTCNKVTSVSNLSVHLNSEEHKAARVSLGGIRMYDHEQIKIKENIVYGDDTDDASNFEELPIKKVIPVSKELETYVNQHGMYVTHDNFTIYCKMCSLMLPGALHNIKEHIIGKKHIENTKRWVDNEPYRMTMEKVRSKDYFTQTLIAMCSMRKYVIINNSVCVEFDNFFCLTNIEKIICNLCEEEVPPEDDILTHLVSPSHVNGLRNAFVITSLKEEFVRQINSQYQCVFCNFYTPSYGLILYHLSTPQHEYQKVRSKQILQQIKKESIINIGEVELHIFDFDNFDTII